MGYSRLEPGRELEVREYISFQRGRDGFCELIECSVDELLERKAESIVREKELCQRIDAAVEVWSKQAQQTQQYMKALEYVKTPPTPHTSMNMATMKCAIWCSAFHGASMNTPNGIGRWKNLSRNHGNSHGQLHSTRRITRTIPAMAGR